MLQVPLMSIASGAASSSSSTEPVSQKHGTAASEGSSSSSSSSSASSVELGSLWHRVDQRSWIVGLSVHNRTSRSFNNLVIT